jgi:hypothetical protein
VSSRADLEARFPSLVGARWESKSPFDRHYNCVGWAACDDNHWWWPGVLQPPPAVRVYWPPGISHEEDVEAFIQAFGTLGYELCNNGRWQLGYEKVAIYADRDLTPTHMARQRLFGGWTSKLGELEDIHHGRPEDVECDTSPFSDEYGKVIKFLRRSWWHTFKHWRARRETSK